MPVFIKDPVGWHHVTESRSGPFGINMLSRGQRLRLLSMRQVGVDTGRLRSSIHTNFSNSNAGSRASIIVRVGSNNPIALLHHEGTKAHEIVPRRAKVLRFPQNGMIRYAMRVWHPGTRPNRYLTDNLSKVV